MRRRRVLASKPRGDWLALAGEHREGAFVNAAEGLMPDEALERFDAKRELPARKRALRPETPVAQVREIVRQEVLRPIDEAQVFTAAAFQCGLRQAT